ncbi:MAG: TolC family protein [Armatimonadetes bacterium]|nr:TolC family protein [Armatimonadota bacterium]MDE2206891.1 TolC family protein [Armatimonadota bacterium]
MTTACLVGGAALAAQQQPNGATTARPSNATFTLTQALRASLANPRTSTTWQLTTDASASHINVSRAAFLPVVTGVLGVSAVSSGNVTLFSSEVGGFAGFARGHTRAGVDVEYPVYDGGKRLAQLHSDTAAYRSAVDGVRTDQVSALMNTLIAFYTTLQNQRLVASSGAAVAAARQHLVDAQARLQVGLVAKGEVLTAQSALSQAIAVEEARNGLLSASRAHLANLLGGDPATLVPKVSDPAEELPITDSRDKLVAEAMAFDPQKQAIYDQRASARYQLSTIRADLSPVVSIGASFGYLFATNNNFGPYVVASADLGIPLFEQENVHAREREQLDAVHKLSVAAEQDQADLKEQVETIYSNYVSGAAAVVADRDSVMAAREALRLAQEQYQVGKGTQTSVLDAIHLLATAQDNLALELTARDIAEQTLNTLTGGYADLLPAPVLKPKK